MKRQNQGSKSVKAFIAQTLKRRKTIQTTLSTQKHFSTKDKSSKNNNMNVSIDTYWGKNSFQNNIVLTVFDDHLITIFFPIVIICS